MRLLSALIAALLLSLAACAAPTANGGGYGKGDTTTAAAPAPDGADQAGTASPPAPKKPMRTGGPLPPERVRTDAPVALDYNCRTNADCAVKNVGNCCGYYPACVNVDSPTDPKGVQAQCAKQGMASVCGFAEISACTCNQGRCEAESAEMVQ